MALIEIDGLRKLIAWCDFPWRTVNVITTWYVVQDCSFQTQNGATKHAVAIMINHGGSNP